MNYILTFFLLLLGVILAYLGHRFYRGHKEREEAKEELIQGVKKDKDKDVLEEEFGEEYIQYFIDNGLILEENGEISLNEERKVDLEILGLGIEKGTKREIKNFLICWGIGIIIYSGLIFTMKLWGLVAGIGAGFFFGLYFYLVYRISLSLEKEGATIGNIFGLIVLGVLPVSIFLVFYKIYCRFT